MSDFTTIIQLLEELPTAGRVVDTIRGAVVGLAAGLHAIEEAQVQLGHRLAALEGQRSTSPAPRKRGRPPGAKNKASSSCAGCRGPTSASWDLPGTIARRAR
jgi:hypothetical protein